MSFPLRIPDQLKPHLRSLRKGRGLTQSGLGELVGVKQARIAEIEANPGAVSLDQLVQLLAALGATLHLHAVEVATAQAGKPARTGSGSIAPATKVAKAVSRPRAQVPSAPTRRPAVKPASPRKGVVTRTKKGVW